MGDILKTFRKAFSNNSIYKFFYFFLFIYFGLMIIPSWFLPFSPQFIMWIVSLPVIILFIIVVGISGLIGIQKTKTRNMDSNPKHVFFIQLSSFCLLWIAIAYGLANWTHYLYYHQKFNSEVWQNPNSAGIFIYDTTPRQKMIDDLIENILFESTQAEIEVLLGPSINTGYFSKSESDLIYVLGPERGFGVDYEWLLIWCDDAGNFERYAVVTD